MPNFAFLDWGKNNAFKDKVLSLVAWDILDILVSTVTLESTFSTRGRILDPFRSSFESQDGEGINVFTNLAA